MAAKRIKIDNASSKFRRQSQKREQKVIRCSVLIVCEGTNGKATQLCPFWPRRIIPFG